MNYASAALNNSTFVSKPEAQLLAEDKFTFGKQNRPGTPIKDVIGGFYQGMGEEMQKSRYTYYQKTGQPVKLAADKPTKASQLAHTFTNTRVHKDPAQERDLFKLRKFQRIAPRTETHHGKRSKTPAGYGAHKK
jgi:hypothetical protein